MSEVHPILMRNRIRRILLVCNNYDNFFLEEDGQIEEQITREYADLNLSNPPAFKRVENTTEAYSLISGGEAYDLVITMYNVGDMDVFEFSRKVKAITPDTPLVLLSSFSKVIYSQLYEQDLSCIDFIFCWNNNTDLIIAIIKLLEDKLNAEHDMAQGVRAILLIEDSIRYYSTYLPLLYKIVLQQNINSMSDTLNEKQKVICKRSRPKILMATCYEEAVQLYQKYKSNIMGIISDIGFVIHKGDKAQNEKGDAGIDFCRLVKEDNPRMPFLMQSSQESMRAVANMLGVGFVRKSSKTLTHDLSEYIGKNFGFGDFVATNPDSGKEIGRARNLYEFEQLLRILSARVYRSLGEQDYLSHWLYGRGFFALGNIFRPIRIHDESEVEAVRQMNLRAIREFRISLGLGVVAEFDSATYNDALWFTRLGSGSMGGKARGLAFLNHILQKYDLFDKWQDVRVMVPRTLVVTTEYFDRFILENGLQYVINSDISDAEILSEFVASTLPQELTTALRAFLHHTHKPLAIRSSSKLEDSYYQPFAGVYSTYMIPHTENIDQELRLLSKAIKSVYASVFFAASRSYITATSNVLSEEKMAIVIQEVCGSEDCGRYFPTFSGVARSLNFYPVGYEKADDGVVKLAFGLGKAVVDGEQVLRFVPAYPKKVLQTSTPELTMRDTQQVMYALDLQPDKFKTSVDDAVNLERIPISECGKFRNLARVASTWDYESMRMVDSPFASGPKYITFSHILNYNTFPLASILQELLGIAQREMHCCVEMEFAADLDRPKGETSVFNVLQIRPISTDSSNEIVDWTKVSSEEAFLRSGSALGTGWIEDVRDIVYLRPEAFDVLKTQEIASELSSLNARLRSQGRCYALIGFGRWGSSIPSLGVPVGWGDISEARAIVECCLENFRVDPSQGTHFFQNMTSFNVGYVNVNPFAREGDMIDFEALEACIAEYETQWLRLLHFEHPLLICIDGYGSRALMALPES